METVSTALYQSAWLVHKNTIQLEQVALLVLPIVKYVKVDHHVLNAQPDIH